jgi:hypothetical protein
VHDVLHNRRQLAALNGCALPHAAGCGAILGSVRFSAPTSYFLLFFKVAGRPS